MKKYLLPALAILGLLFVVLNRFGCGKSGGSKIRVERITKETKEQKGDWQTVDFEETDSPDSSDVRLADIVGERDHYFQRYTHYKREDAYSKEKIAELENKLVNSNSESAAVEILNRQIEKMKSKARRDSILIASLFADMDRPIEPKLFKGSEKGENFETFVEVTAFGHVPDDGIKIKTDLTSTTTTIEKPFEVWKKNTVEVYVGTDVADWQYLLGAGYERRGRILGIFLQGDVIPNTKEFQGRVGGRVHF